MRRRGESSVIPARDRDPHRDAAEMKSQGFDRCSQLIGDVQRRFELQAAQQHGEFFAADARDKIARRAAPP